MGKTFPEGPSPAFPPNRWICPKELGGCGKEHAKPHFPFPKQIDEKKQPGEMGRVKFNRMKDEETLDPSTKVVKKYVGEQAPLYDKEDKPQPLFCPHCGFTLEGVLLVNVTEVQKN